jgi:hypothetical protein
MQACWLEVQWLLLLAHVVVIHICHCHFLLLQGTLRQALDAGLLVNKGTGCHYLPTVLSLAHNIACAMHYLHQASIQLTGSLKLNVASGSLFR